MVELNSVGVNVVVEVNCYYVRVGLAEVDTTRVEESMGRHLAAVSVGERDVPVCVDGDDAGESKEYSLESNHYNSGCWLGWKSVEYNTDFNTDVPCDWFVTGLDIRLGYGFELEESTALYTHLSHPKIFQR